MLQWGHKAKKTPGDIHERMASPQKLRSEQPQSTLHQSRTPKTNRRLCTNRRGRKCVTKRRWVGFSGEDGGNGPPPEKHCGHAGQGWEAGLKSLPLKWQVGYNVSVLSELYQEKSKWLHYFKSRTRTLRTPISFVVKHLKMIKRPWLAWLSGMSTSL